MSTDIIETILASKPRLQDLLDERNFTERAVRQYQQAIDEALEDRKLAQHRLAELNAQIQRYYPLQNWTDSITAEGP